MSVAPPQRPGDQWQQPFWEAVDGGRIVVQRCERGHHQLPGGPICARCAGSVEWVPIGGGGTLWSHATFHQCYFPELAEQLPYTVLVVELDEGLRIICAPTPGELDPPRIGARVQLAVGETALGSVPLARAAVA